MFGSKPGELYQINLLSTADVVVNQGGTSSGKTYSILQVLFTKAAREEKLVITVVGQDIPNLKAGALRDALSIYNDSPDLKSAVRAYNKTDRIFEFHNDSIIEFKSYDSAQDAKSGKRDYLFVNEANGISFQVYTELALRTKVQVFIDYNPNEQFWVHDQIIPSIKTQLIISDHRHNPYVPQKMRDNIEALKDIDIELWKVYARGKTGKIEGLIFPNCRIVPEIPQEARLLADGLDFGFTNDPTADIAIYKLSGELWLDERIYEIGMTNYDISNRYKTLGYSKSQEIVADSAEPKSIAEIRSFGWNIHPTKKGADSILNGIDILKRYRMNITSRSKNLIREQKSYKWKVDKDGKSLNEPVEAYNHGWDATRYVALKHLAEQGRKGPKAGRSYGAHINN